MDNLGTFFDISGRRRSSRLHSKKESPKSKTPPKTPPKTPKPKTPKPKTPKPKTPKPKTPKPKTPTKTSRLNKLFKTNKISRARSLDFNIKKSSKQFRNYKSLSLSPIYNKKYNISLNKTINNINEILKYRLNTYEYLQNIKDIRYYLNIQKLLANIEKKATGIVCLSNNSDIILYNKTINNFKFAIKIAENITSDSVKEIYILTKILDYIKKGYHNLPIIYTTFNKIRKSDILKNIKTSEIVFDNIKEFLKDNKNYNIYINELANGDLKNFLNSYDSDNSDITNEIFLNAVAQILMAIATLHDIGIKHNDTHYGNFLYHKIIPGGYIKYTIKNETYYVKNLGYLWVIWDFGISTQLNGKYEYFYDYEMLSLFLRKDEGKYNMRFIAKNENNLIIRRNHGNINFKNKIIPREIVNLTDTIYNYSIDKSTNIKPYIKPDIQIDYGYKLLTSKDPNMKKELSDISMNIYRIKNNKNEDIDEVMFLQNIISLLPVFEKNLNLDDKDILFHINLQLDNISFITKKDKNNIDRSDYQATIKYYEGRKIVLPELFY